MTSVEKAIEVKNRHKQDLLDIPAVVGLGVGGTKKDPNVTVNVTQFTREIQERIPKQLEDIKVKVKEVGKIVA